MVLITLFVFAQAEFFPLNNEQRNLIVQRHNDLRKQWGVSRPLTYDLVLENVAQNHNFLSLGKTCDLKLVDHPNKNSAYGENLATFQNHPFDFQLIEKSIKMWQDETKGYSHSQLKEASKNPTSEIGHVTQMLAARTQKIGCSQYRKPNCDLVTVFCECTFLLI